MNALSKQIAQNSTSPFMPQNHDAYAVWRQAKLKNYPAIAENLRVEISDPQNLTTDEKTALRNILCKTNVAIYSCKGQAMTKTDVRILGRQLGLEHLDNNLCADEDSITSLQVMNSGCKGGYIPYTNRRLSWHTDGYYNPFDRQVRAIVMHCDTPAKSGGENMLLDHEMLYLHLRDVNPDYIHSLMHPEVMIIPPNEEGGEEIRAETVGPVFSIDAKGNLHMRYSARSKNIVWRDNENTQQATSIITELLNGNSPYMFRYRLNANEGVISNNVLHNRTAFEDDEQNKRLLYRARYFDRVAGTDVNSKAKPC